MPMVRAMQRVGATAAWEAAAKDRQRAAADAALVAMRLRAAADAAEVAMRLRAAAVRERQRAAVGAAEVAMLRAAAVRERQCLAAKERSLSSAMVKVAAAAAAVDVLQSH